ncbi:MAG: hypothetical protein HY583_03115 [Candidatus Omnitrophica bacterium]|nr:hypothetical protein [Candidatus Omnitrophota bacterium]
MLETLGNYIKVAVDISKGVLAGGGILHADCESVLIQDGSKQEDIWGADWFPENGKIRFEAMINIAPRRKNRSMEIQDQTIRNKVVDVIQTLLGDK